ncbi:hypothetical protein C3L33_08564, partial [Rhododendron williamsianum]
MYSSILRRPNSTTSPPLLHSLTFLRPMGGGPRTFPGGLNKWQWKRMHEKKAKEKEKRLLDQEKQLYQARIRSQIRAELAPQQPPGNRQPDPNYGPMSADDHIKALADRFMKAGAEDLWNEADGPIKSAPEPKPVGRSGRTPIDIRKLISESEGRNSTDLMKSSKPRHYSVVGQDSDDEFGDGEEGKMRGRDNAGKLMSSAGLGKYDVKKTRRVPLKFLEEEENLSERVEAIRKEFNMRNWCRMQWTEVMRTRFLVKRGKDALVKAKTGTGKSAAFLLPAIETVLKASSSNTVQRVPPVYVLILCPTRELASQIAAETNVMLRYHDGFGVQTLVGGTRFKVDQKRLESDPCQIIVATPGRLLDHIENKSGLSVRLMGLKMLILDEADHLLDLGFRKDMEKIVDCLPRQRQSLLFSATIPKEVRRISQLVLKREHALSTLWVKQFTLVTPHELHFQVVHHLLNEHISQTLDYKVVVFCTTAVVTSLMFLLLRDMKMNVREIHSRKPQLYRTRISDEFKESKRLILITSDVSARGMNYPDVTLVIQVGIPSDRENYIHRLGRTGREGKEGEGILLLAPWEEYFLHEIKDLPVEKYPAPQLDPDVKIKIENSMAKIDTSMKEAAYHAWLGYYNSIKEIGRDKTTLVELANQFCHSIGLEKTPALFRKTALKMGLKDIRGIKIRR